MEDLVEKYKALVQHKSQIVSVFMLTHNRAQYLKKAITSVLNQTYTNFTLIVFDNCSEDDTESAVASFTDPRIIYYYRKSTLEDANSAFARNICITPYFIILHDDDIVEDKYLETVIYEMENNHYDALSVRCSLIDENDKIVRKSSEIREKIIYNGDGYFKDLISGGNNGFIYPSVIYKTTFYKEFPNFAGTSEIGPAGDQFIWLESERKGGTLCLYGEELIRYRRHSNQESSKSDGFRSLQLYDYLLKDKYYHKLIDRNITNVEIRVFKLYRTLVSRYFRESISYKDVGRYFRYNIVRYTKHNLRGLLYYIITKISNLLIPVLKIPYNMLRK